jgi:hypothetical protein
MTMYYSDPRDEKDPNKRPDIEVFYRGPSNRLYQPGWYWWHREPDSIPDSEPTGPFDTEQEALADARVPNIWLDEEDTNV